MRQKLQDPVKAYANWLNSIPVPHRKYLAYMFWLCTTENTADLTLTADEAWTKFTYYLVRDDFPLRRIARLVTVRAVTDFILRNRTILMDQQEQGAVAKDEQEKLHFLSEKQWERVWTSWVGLISRDLSDEAFTAWMQHIINK